MFNELTEELLDLQATAHGDGGRQLFAMVQTCCCCSCCTCLFLC
jgi:hypothetical protein